MSDTVDIGAIRARIDLDISQFNKGVDTAKSKLTGLDSSAEEVNKSFGLLKARMAELGASSAQIDKINAAIRKANPEILRKQIAEVTDEMRKLGLSSTEINKVTQELQRSATGASMASREVKALALAYAGLAAGMAAIIAKSVQTSAQFEQAMANVKAISEATGKEFEQLRKQAIDLGAATVFSAAQAADAQANLAQA
ncbi:phage tail tape measure protein [Paenibacillus tuaregi]|uniref:phage tail tape measure protein n=1 Tax=Paenibacillus tuaregi TaxID=1816681 RepID=UPI0008388F41|nr:phage tail tape measure protein [Paenibacillus tuaregi]